jgi:hypothetical protein
MPSNIEKLAEELNALADYDPMALECLDATVSLTEKRIYLPSFTPDSAVFHIDFDQVLPYDPSGAPETTSDVFAGARISLNVTLNGSIRFKDQEDADAFAKGYLKMVRFSLWEAAKEGRISSKTLAETNFSAAELEQHAAEHAKTLNEAKEHRKAWLNSFDPETREALIKVSKEQCAKRKAEGRKVEDFDDD